MRKQKQDATEHSQNWDSGTYQTGSTTPPKEHRGLIAVLMILVTFLGGLASALGLINIRLLQQLAQADDQADAVSLYQNPADDTLPTTPKDVPTPSIPDAPEELEIPIDQPETGSSDQQLSLQTLLERNGESLVQIRCGAATDTQICGVILDEQGYVLTNAYPVSDNTHIYVTLSDGRSCRAALVGTDEFTDLAVLYIDLPDLTAAQFAAADTLEYGDAVAALSGDRQMIQGNLTCADYSYTVSNQTLHVLQTDLTGCAGPIYNSYGQIIGYRCTSLSENGKDLVIPSILMKDVAQQIISKGFCTGRPSLGVQMEQVDSVYQQYWQLPSGLRITQIQGQTDMLSGLEQGDILIRLNGRPVSDRISLCAVLRTLRTGDRVEAVVLRANEQITLTLVIGASGK